MITTPMSLGSVYNIRVVPGFIKGIRIWGAEGCDIHIAGIKTETITSNDYIIDFEKILMFIYRFEADGFRLREEARHQNTNDVFRRYSERGEASNFITNHIITQVVNDISHEPEQYQRGPNGRQWGGLNIRKNVTIDIRHPDPQFDVRRISHSLIMRARG